MQENHPLIYRIQHVLATAASTAGLVTQGSNEGPDIAKYIGAGIIIKPAKHIIKQTSPTRY